MALRSPLGRVKGLGAAKSGVGLWWAQRLSALALVPLTVWFVASVVAMAGADYFAVRDWMASPVVAGLLILLTVAGLHHGALGLQVVVEDYVHNEGAKIASLLLVKGAALVLGLIGVLSVLTVLFKG